MIWFIVGLLLGAVIGLAIGLFFAAKSYDKGREEGYNEGRENGLAAGKELGFFEAMSKKHRPFGMNWRNTDA